MKYRRITTEVEAEKVSDLISMFENKKLPIWAQKKYEKGDLVPTNNSIHVYTTDGLTLARENDYVILEDGYLLVMNRYIFKNIFQEIS